MEDTVWLSWFCRKEVISINLTFMYYKFLFSVVKICLKKIHFSLNSRLLNTDVLKTNLVIPLI